MRDERCLNCTATGFIWLGYLRRLVSCPICLGTGADAKLGEQERRCSKCRQVKPHDEFKRTRRCRACENASVRRRSEACRAQVLEHYGTVCACCGTTDDLTIDHINGDGQEHRKELFGSTKAQPAAFYRWLVRSGFPDGFQTLCRLCNSSKGQGGRCRRWHGSSLVTSSESEGGDGA